MNKAVDQDLVEGGYQGNELQSYSSQTAALVLDNESMTSMMRLAEFMAKGVSTLPKHLSNPSDCLAVVMQAMQWKMNPYAVAQKTHIVNGALGYEAQLVNAVVSSSGLIKGRFHYEYQGDGNSLSCRVGAVIAGEESITWNEWLSVASVTTKNSPLWKTNPKQQLGYLQVKNWARAYTPGAILGVYTPDELAGNEAPERIKPDPARDILPEFPDERFQAALPTYTTAIKKGRKNADDVIGMVETKWMMTEDQKKQIRSIKQAAEDAPEQGE